MGARVGSYVDDVVTLASARAEALLAAVGAAVAAAAVVALAPPAGDAPAHLYRTLLVEEGVHVWDNLWYGGQYPLVSYSLLYYLPAAVVGNVPLVVGAVIVSAALFASLVMNEWGEAARWPARVFGVLASGPLFMGTYSYALGFAALLGTLRALQAGRPWLALACAALTLGFSPLAFIFLCLVLLAVLIVRRRFGRRTLALGAGFAVLACVELVALTAFPTEGVYPFRGAVLVIGLAVSGLGAALALRTPRGAPLAVFFLLWGLLSVAVYLVASPVGENLTRIRFLLLPLMLLAAVLARFRPRWLAVTALAAAFAINVAPFLRAAPARADVPAAEARFWAPALDFLQRNESPNYRVEVVPTLDHWEAYWVPRAGFALARGWYRQLDIAQNPVLYRDPLSPTGYRAWLRTMSVRYVLLPNTRLGPMGAEREAELLRSGRSGLIRVFTSGDWAIYELRDPVPILTGPGESRIIALGHDRIEGWTTTPGRHLLRVRYTPYWSVRGGSVCVRRAPGGMTLLDVRRSGRFVLAVSERPGAVVRSALGGREVLC